MFSLFIFHFTLFGCFTKDRAGLPCVGAAEKNDLEWINQFIGQSNDRKGVVQECAVLALAASSGNAASSGGGDNSGAGSDSGGNGSGGGGSSGGSSTTSQPGSAYLYDLAFLNDSVYAVGYVTGSLTSGTTPTGSDQKAFIMKVNASTSDAEWVKEFGPQPGGASNSATANAIEPVGNDVLFCGNLYGDFDSITTGGPNYNSTFLRRMDPNGNVTWTGLLQASEEYKEVRCGGVASSDGNWYAVSGYAYGGMKFGSGSGTNNAISTGSADVYIAKFNSSNTYPTWVTRSGGLGGISCSGVSNNLINLGNELFSVGDMTGGPCSGIGSLMLYNRANAGSINFKNTVSLTSTGTYMLLHTDGNGAVTNNYVFDGTKISLSSLIFANNSFILNNSLYMGMGSINGDSSAQPFIGINLPAQSQGNTLMKLDLSSNPAANPPTTTHTIGKSTLVVDGSKRIVGTSVAYDNAGNITMATYSNADILSQTRTGSLDTFLIRFTENGTTGANQGFDRIWVKSFGEAGKETKSTAITSNKVSGDFYIGGVQGLSIFVAKFDQSGNLVWQRKWNATRRN